MDDAGFEAFYRAVYPRLVGQLYPVLGSLAEAEDVAQEALFRAAIHWRRLATYDAPEAWTRRVALRLTSNILRSVRRQATAWKRYHPPQDTPSLQPEDLALITALGQIPLKYRQVLVLHHCLDLSVAEVARSLSIPPGTVKARLVKGRQRLAAALGATTPNRYEEESGDVHPRA